MITITLTDEQVAQIATQSTGARPDVALTPADFEANFRAAVARDNWKYQYQAGVPFVVMHGSLVVQQETQDAQLYDEVATKYERRTGEVLSFERYWTKDDWKRYQDGDTLPHEGTRALGWNWVYPAVTLPLLP